MTRAKGFTITELMFAMSMLAIVLLILLASILQLTRTYNKGITLKQVNQNGRVIGDELTRAIRLAGTASIAQPANRDRVCFGSNSFIWTNDNSSSLAKTYNRYNGASGQLVTGFVKVSGVNLCSSPNSFVPRDQATQLLKGGEGAGSENDESGLVMRGVTVSIPLNSKLVSISYTISTSDPDGDLISSGKCKGSSGDDFCALNRFNVTVYARGY